MSIEHSRSLRLAAGASNASESELRQRQEAALTTVSFDPDLPGADLTARVLLTTLRRLPGKLALLPANLPAGLAAELKTAVDAVDGARPLQLLKTAPEAAVELAISTTADGRTVRVIPDGYGAHIVTAETAEVTQQRRPHALGCVFAAALGAAEAFKHIVVDKADRRTIHEHLAFCPVTLTGDVTLAPELPDSVALNTALVGCGAIGTAIALVLAEEQVFSGKITVCDYEHYGPENRGTYTLGGDVESANQPPKVDIVSDLLAAHGFTVEKVFGKSTDLTDRIDAGQLPMPDTVLTGLDSKTARHDTQRLWPSHIFDGATGDTAVGMHHAVPEGPCLHCFFPEANTGPDPLLLLAHETGLPVSRLKRGQDALTEEDLAQLTDEQRDRLRGFLGHPVCGLADAFGLSNAGNGDYRPSVPFVSQVAACLAVGKLIAHELGVDTGNFMQFDVLHGPVAAEPEQRRANPSCRCQTRAAVVSQLRSRRVA